MKFALKASVVAAALALASGAQAATILDSDTGANNGADVLVNILNQDTGDSLVIDTRLNSADLLNGTVTDYTSGSALTTSINAFLGGTTNAKFWALGLVKDALGFNITSLATSSIFFDGPGELDGYGTNYNSYINDLNDGSFGLDTAGDGPDIENVGASAQLGFSSPNFGGFADGVAVGDSSVWKQTTFSLLGGGTSTGELQAWSLAADGTLHYGAAVSAVPVPAAAWLFGSGLIGLVSVARRRVAS